VIKDQVEKKKCRFQTANGLVAGVVNDLNRLIKANSGKYKYILTVEQALEMASTLEIGSTVMLEFNDFFDASDRIDKQYQKLKDDYDDLLHSHCKLLLENEQSRNKPAVPRVSKFFQ